LQNSTSAPLSEGIGANITADVRIPSLQFGTKFIEAKDMKLDPVGSTRKTAQSVKTYFSTWVDFCRGDLKQLGVGKTNPYLVVLLNSQFCDALCHVFDNGFVSPFSFFFTKSRPWHAIEEIASTDETLKLGVNMVNQMVLEAIANQTAEHVNGYARYFSLSYDEFDMRFRALIIWALNNSYLQNMLRIVTDVKSAYVLDKYYNGDALVKEQNCVDKIIQSIQILDKLPFNVDPMTALDSNSLNQHVKAYPEIEHVKNMIPKEQDDEITIKMQNQEQMYRNQIEEQKAKYRARIQ
jgi:hypothetical protein